MIIDIIFIMYKLTAQKKFIISLHESANRTLKKIEYIIYFVFISDIQNSSNLFSYIAALFDKVKLEIVFFLAYSK